MDELINCRLKPEQIRSQPGFENKSDAEIEKIIDGLFQLSLIAFEIHKSEESKMKNFKLIHEAAHAVAAFHFNVPFNSISGEYPFEKVEYVPTDKEVRSKVSKSQTDAIVKRLIKVDFAGSFAERKYYGKVNTEYVQDDLANIKKYKEYLTGNKEKVLMGCYQEVSKLFGGLTCGGEEDENINWQTALVLAKTLEKSKELTYEEACSIIREMTRKPKRDRG